MRSLVDVGELQARLAIGWDQRRPQSHVEAWLRKVDIRLPGKGNSNSHGARPVY